MNSVSGVSEEFRLVLENYVYEVLKSQPKDLYQFSADHFAKLYASKKDAGDSLEISSPPPALHELPQENTNGLDKVSSPSSAGAPASFEETANVPETLKASMENEEKEAEDEEDDDIMDMPDLKNRFLGKSARRHSVAAESFDPEKIDNSEIKVYEKTEEQKDRLKEAVKPIFIFRSLEQNQIPRLIDAMQERSVEQDEVVIKQGDDGDNFYVIESGIYDIFVNDQKVGSYDNQGSFGELALMYNCPRAATIIAKTSGILWAMDRESFLKIVLHAAFKKRRTYEQLLASAKILSPLSDYARTNLADALFSREYENGAEICHEGDLGDEMFFVEQGEVAVLTSRGSDGAERELRKIEKGGFFGELALLTDGHRNATIKAVNNVRLAVLDRSSFERLMGPCIDLMKGQSKAYLEDIIAQLGQEAVAKYPSLTKLIGQEAPAAAPEEQKPADESAKTPEEEEAPTSSSQQE